MEKLASDKYATGLFWLRNLIETPGCMAFEFENERLHNFIWRERKRVALGEREPRKKSRSGQTILHSDRLFWTIQIIVDPCRVPNIG